MAAPVRNILDVPSYITVARVSAACILQVSWSSFVFVCMCGASKMLQKTNLSVLRVYLVITPFRNLSNIVLLIIRRRLLKTVARWQERFLFSYEIWNVQRKRVLHLSWSRVISPVGLKPLYIFILTEVVISLVDLKPLFVLRFNWSRVISLVDLKPLYSLHFDWSGFLACRLETIIHSAFELKWLYRL
jgi:hypothetical protein